MCSVTHPDNYGQPHHINFNQKYILDSGHGTTAALGHCSSMLGLFLWSKKDLVTAASLSSWDLKPYFPLMFTNHQRVFFFVWQLVNVSFLQFLYFPHCSVFVLLNLTTNSAYVANMNVELKITSEMWLDRCACSHWSSSH